MYWIDFRNQTAGTYFFKVFGRNPLPIYLLSELLVTILYTIQVGDIPLYQWIYQNIFIYAGDYLASLLFAITYMLLCWSVGYILDKNKVYIRV
jgi:predicted acyltransferase